jgi:RimJ/RimL family protein N-acetyltransferase
LPELIERIKKRNEQAQQEHKLHEIRSMALAVSQFGYIGRPLDHAGEQVLGRITRADAERACANSERAFVGNAEKFEQFKNQLFSRLGVDKKEEITLTTCLPYDLIIDTSLASPEECAYIIKEKIRKTVEKNNSVGKRVLETERLVIREFVIDDVPALLNIMADGGMPHLAQFGPLDINYARGFLERMIESYKVNGFGLWAVIEKSTGELIGYCGLHRIKIEVVLSAVASAKEAAKTEEHVELAYRIYRPLWGRGLAPEAASAVYDYAFAVLKFPEIVSCIAPTNTQSMRVAEKVGLTYWKEGIFKGMPCRVYRKINNT